MRTGSAFLLLTIAIFTMAATPPRAMALAAQAPAGGLQVISPNTFIPTFYPRGARLFWTSGDFQLITDRYVAFGATGTDGRMFFSWDVRQVRNAGGVLWQVSRVDFPPFAGGASQDMHPHGLVASGRALGTGGAFEINIASMARDMGLWSAPRTLARSSGTVALRYPFRVRVNPVGSVRQRPIVGYPSNTLTTYYGKEPPQPPYAIEIRQGAERQGRIAITRVGYRLLHSYRTPADCDPRGAKNRDPLLQFVEVVVDAWEWVTTFYSNIKQAAVSVVTSILPLPDSVVAYALDAALLAAGIPPTLPNLDQLMDEGADYLAMAAVQQAGLPAGDDMAREALKKGIRAAADEAARQAKNVTITEGRPCEWRDVPSRLTVTLRNDDADVADVTVSAGTVWDLYPTTTATLPLLKRGQALAVPLVLRPSLSMRYFDGQLYRGGALWFEALRTQRTEFRITVTARLVRADGSSTHVRREFTTPGQVWDKDHILDF